MTIPTAEVVGLLVRLIRNRCVNDGTEGSGQEIRSVRTLQSYLGVDGVVVEPAPGRASVVFRVPGTVPGAPRLAFLPHLDVVPANEEAWSVPPFEAVRGDGWVWGRGAVDMLNLTAAMAAVFRRYVDGTLPPLPGDLLLVAVADEEAGGTLGAAHLVERHWDLVRCDDLLTEVGAPELRGPAGVAVPVTVAEKGPAWTRLRLRGRAGHGSQPHRTANATVLLAEAVMAVVDTEPEVVVTDAWRRFADALPLPDRLRRDLADPGRVDGALAELGATDLPLARWVHASTRMTVAPTVGSAGAKANQIPDRASVDLDARVLPGQGRADLEEYLDAVLAAVGDAVSVEPVLDHPPTVSPTEGPLWEAIEASVEGEAVPMLSVVATDARFFRARAVRAYGVAAYAGTMDFGEMLGMFHGPDERVSEASLAATARLLARIVEAYRDRSR